MPSFSAEAFIGMKLDVVWDILADYGNITAWNSGIHICKLTSNGEVGVGAIRH